jgi:[protein-PII] uridylyltransferase
MAHVSKRRDIIDRKALVAVLDDLVGWSGYSAKIQARVLEIFKDALGKGRAEIRRRFEDERAAGSEVVRENAYLIDQLVRTIHDFALKYVYPAANPMPGEQLSVVATGGYGRGELAPHSDIDLLFLVPYKRTAHTEQMVEYMLYMLWDLGLTVGHATRTVDDNIRLARGDLTIRTSLLEARWVWGDKDQFDAFKARYAKDIVKGSGADFVDAKLAERDARHERMGDTRYVLEPNIKEGKGGLRDLQTLFWIAKYLYRVDDVKDLVNLGVLTARDARRFAKAENFLWTVRCHLHYLAGRAEERLTFNVQATIGERMGYTDHAGTRGVERVMKHYFLIAKDVGDLTRVLCAVLEERHKKRRQRFRFPSLSFRRRGVEGFRVDGNRLTVEADDAFVKDPVKLLRLFHEAQRHGLDIHPDALRLVTQSLKLIDGGLRADPEANRLFMEILTSDQDPETALKRLNEAGVFGRFIPDFGRVVAQMQYDMYHVYTVDEHTIRAIGVLHRIEKGELTDDHPVSAAAIAEVQSRRVLYLALLLHDIAKGRGGDHSEIGARIAEKLGPRLGLNDWETETVSWLVRHHLLMSATAFKRDIDNLRTVSDFVAAVQSPERLRLLLILTVADIRAVGPGVWNGWKATLLRELYWRAQEEMAGDVPAERRAARVENAKAALRDRLAGWDPSEVEEHIGRGYADYWLSFDTDTHVRHADLVRKAERGGLELHIETHVDASRAVTEIIIYTPDHPGLFARIAGAMALGAASIVDAKILTLANGMALDTFTIQDSRGGPFDNPERLKRLWKRIEDALSGRLHPARELEIVRRRSLPSRMGVFKVPPRVLVDNKASAHHTVIEVNGRDRPGFLHDVTAALTGLGLQIASAHISTYGERVVDVFYVKDVFGLKVERKDKLSVIERRLLAAIVPAGDKDAAPAEGVAAAE